MEKADHVTGDEARSADTSSFSNAVAESSSPIQPANTTETPSVQPGKAAAFRGGDRFGQLYTTLRARLIRSLPVVNKDVVESFAKLDPALRAAVILAWILVPSVAVLALVVPVVLLPWVHYDGQQLTQVWIMSVSLCSYVFLFLLIVSGCSSLYDDLSRLSYGLLFAFFAATVIGQLAAIFFLHLTMVWAAGYLGYSLAVHRLNKGAERAIDLLPKPSCRSQYEAEYRTASIKSGAKFSMVLSTALMAWIMYMCGEEDMPHGGLSIVFILSYMGWIHAFIWVLCVANTNLHGVLVGDKMKALFSGMLPCMLGSPAIILISELLSALFQSLLLMFLVAFVGYNIAVYIRYLHTAGPAQREKQESTPDNMQHPDAHEGRLKETIAFGNANEHTTETRPWMVIESENELPRTENADDIEEKRLDDDISIEINRVQQRDKEMNEYC